MTSLSVPPQVVGTISPEGLAALAALPAAERVADIVEARFDLAINPPPPPQAGGTDSVIGAPASPPPAGTAPPLPDLRPFFGACLRLEQTGTPVLATIRLTADGGRWPEDAGRLAWFREAMQVVSWVDIETESAIAADVVALARAGTRQCRVIVSHHDFTKTPGDAELDSLVDRGRALGADVVKIATAITSLQDHHRLLDLLRRHEVSGGTPLALIGMGALGTPLRSYLAAVGSRLTYGFLDSVAAPGQLHARELVHRLLADCPDYAQWRRGGRGEVGEL